MRTGTIGMKMIPQILIFVLWLGHPTTHAHSTEGNNHPETDVEGIPLKIKFGFPIKAGGDFELVDHNGMAVTNESYQGKHMLVFFGYINCKNMCSLSLTRIGKALEILGPLAEKLTPLVITVDPERDTPEVLKQELAKYHSGLTGLTGSPDQIAVAYKAYKQNPRQVKNDWDGDPVVSHSSYFYLMDRDGKFQTLFPPILNPQSMANIMRKYINPGS